MQRVLVLALLAVSAFSLGQDPANFWVTLTGTAKASDASGACHIRYMGADKGDVYGKLEVKCFHDVAAPTQAHIHLGAAGVSGAVQFPFDNKGASPMVLTTAALNKDQEDALFKDELYVNVHTEAAPGGFARGQIMKGVVGTWYADLDNAQEGGATPPTTGKIGIGWVTRGGTPAAYDVTIWHNIGNSTYGGSAAHIHGPSTGPGNSTGVLYTICTNGPSCVSGNKALKATGLSETNAVHQGWLKAGLTYLNVHNKYFGLPNGEIRGQLKPFMQLTQFMRSGAATTTVGVSVFAAIFVALFARLL